MGAGQLAFDDVRARGVGRHKDISFQSCRAAYAARAPAALPAEGTASFLTPTQAPSRLRRHSPRLEALRWILRFVLNQKIVDPTAAPSRGAASTVSSPHQEKPHSQGHQRSSSLYLHKSACRPASDFLWQGFLHMFQVILNVAACARSFPARTLLKPLYGCGKPLLVRYEPGNVKKTLPPKESRAGDRLIYGDIKSCSRLMTLRMWFLLVRADTVACSTPTWRGRWYQTIF